MSDPASELDIRWPIGLLFVLMGAAVAIFGSISQTAAQSVQHRINLNLAWGVVMLVFGLAMVGGAWRAHRRNS
jgi:hypothetical protein